MLRHKILYGTKKERCKMRKSERRAQKDVKRPPTIRERIADGIGVSKELTLDVAKITMFGAREASVENYIGISEYSDTLIALTAKPNSIRISGANLEIKTMSREIIYLTGKIEKIEYV